MKTETIRIPPRRTAPILPVMFAAGVALVAGGAGYLARGLSSVEAPSGGRPAIEQVDPMLEGWGFVLRADTARVLRHRPALTPAEFVRTHAFGWEGLTVAEVFDNPALAKELRLLPQLSPIDLIRLSGTGRVSDIKLPAQP